ncbi:MAG TPA: aminotransferase class IV [Dehalococcoidia bacterium]|nr:aminotransferase class IV [Dehalococcoidia bacterium]
MQWLYLNGSLVPGEEATVSALDPAVFHGQALVETFAARNNGVFRLADHYDRLRQGGAVLGIVVPISLPDLETAVATLLDRNEADDARLRLTVTAGQTGAEPTVALMASPLDDYPPELYKQGMHVTIADVRRNETSPLSRIKCAAGLLDGLLARETARARNFDDAVLLNTQGSVACGAVANVFIAYHGRILTPPVSSGALPGITRGAVLALAREEGIDATEADFSLRELTGADEAFFTNSVMGVMPVTRIDGTRFEHGLLTAHLQEALHRAASGE